MAVIGQVDIGAITAYADAVNGGYTGTKQEWEALMASYASVAQQASGSATQAAGSASAAATSAGNAQTYAGNAANSASAAAISAGNAETFAQNAEDSAQDASDYAAAAAASAGSLTIDSTLTQSGQTADAKAVGDALTSLMSSIEQKEAVKAPGIYNSLSGPFSVATILDAGHEAGLKELLISVDPVQAGSGDPSPENERPISGWTGCKIPVTGKNLIGKDALRDSIEAYMPSATIDESEKKITFSANASVVSGLGAITGKVKYKEHTGYTFMFYGKNTYTSGSSNTNLRLNYTDGTYEIFAFAANDGSLSYAIIASNPAKTVRSIAKTNQRASTTLYYDQCGVFEGTLTAQDFVPYTGNTYDITFPSEAGTVYGAKIDPVNGTMEVNKAIATLDENTSFSSVSGNTHSFYAENVFPSGITALTNAITPRFLCNQYTEAGYISNSSIAASMASGTWCNQGSYRRRVWIRNENYSTPEDFAASLANNNIQIVYPLDTPVTFTLNPVTIRTLLGLNNIWADCGDVLSVKYALDTKTYIDSTEDAIDQKTDYLEGTKAPAIFKSVSGDLVTFEDGADDISIKDLIINVDPVQSGTGDPSPTNERSISGWTGCKIHVTGKNLLPYERGNISDTGGVDWTIQPDGGIKCVGTATGLGASYHFYADASRKNIPSGTYRFILTGSGTGFNPSAANDGSVKAQLYIDGASRTINTDFQFIVMDTAESVYIRLRTAAITYNCTLYPLLIRVSESDTTFEPYKGNTYDITFPSEAGTVYGAKIYPMAGTLKVTKANIASYAGETLPGAWISDRDVYVEGTTPTTGAQVVYDLASPQTIALDITTIRTLLGLNNIWADCGSIEECTYPVDTKLYIDNLNASVSEPVSEMVATSNIESGKYFTINDQLYLSTTAITQGDAVVPGTNCTETNVPEVLNTFAANQSSVDLLQMDADIAACIESNNIIEANLDYLSMMRGVAIHEDVSQDVHSNNFARVKRHYDGGYWSDTKMRGAVTRWITAAEYEEITGVPYSS